MIEKVPNIAKDVTSLVRAHQARQAEYSNAKAPTVTDNPAMSATGMTSDVMQAITGK